MITVRRWYGDDCVIGRMSVNGFQCFSLELPCQDNQRNISCIPEGVYKYRIRFSPSKRMHVLELNDVPDRSNIQVHAGNYTSQIQGCILVGDGIKHLNSDGIPDTTNSRKTLESVLIHAGDRGTIRLMS